MKRIIFYGIAVAFFTTTGHLFAGDAKSELQELNAQIKAKMVKRMHTEKDYADELAQFDALLSEHKDEKTEDVARILFDKGILYLKVFHDTAKATEILNRVQTEFPQTGIASKATDILALCARHETAKKIQDTLTPGTKFPDFEVTSLDGKPLSIKNYAGKIVLVDFWASWAPACKRHMPILKKVYEKYHDKGFEVIGISLDNYRDTLDEYLTSQKIPWPQYFDGNGWKNELALQYGVYSIPSTFLVDRSGNLIKKNIRSNVLDTEISKALGLKSTTINLSTILH